MSTLTDIATIARWEVKKSFSTMSRDVLPLAIILFVLLVLVTGFTAQTGLHLQDGMYRVGVDDPQVAQLIAGDARFSVYQLEASTLNANRNSFDVIVIRGQASSLGTDKANAALKTLSRDYGKYVNSVYNSETDLFAAYPLWIDSESVKSELRLPCHAERPVYQCRTQQGSPRTGRPRAEYPHSFTNSLYIGGSAPGTAGPVKCAELTNLAVY